MNALGHVTDHLHYTLCCFIPNGIKFFNLTMISTNISSLRDFAYAAFNNVCYGIFKKLCI
jgi:hypothetical protein